MSNGMLSNNVQSKWLQISSTKISLHRKSSQVPKIILQSALNANPKCCFKILSRAALMTTISTPRLFKSTLIHPSHGVLTKYSGSAQNVLHGLLKICFKMSSKHLAWDALSLIQDFFKDNSLRFSIFDSIDHSKRLLQDHTSRIILDFRNVYKSAQE